VLSLILIASFCRSRARLPPALHFSGRKDPRIHHPPARCAPTSGFTPEATLICFPKKTLGSLMDNIEVATPPWSISSIDCATVYFIKGTWPVLRPVISAMNPGDERWW
jgi:hypothetical protein